MRFGRTHCGGARIAADRGGARAARGGRAFGRGETDEVRLLRAEVVDRRRHGARVELDVLRGLLLVRERVDDLRLVLVEELLADLGYDGVVADAALDGEAAEVVLDELLDLLAVPRVVAARVREDAVGE